MFDIQSIYSTHKEKTTNPINKERDEMKTFFSEEDESMATRLMKKYSSSLIIRKLNIKMTMIYHLTSVRMAHIKETHQQACSDNVAPFTPCENIACFNFYRKQYGGFSEK